MSTSYYKIFIINLIFYNVSFIKKKKKLPKIFKISLKSLFHLTLFTIKGHKCILTKILNKNVGVNSKSRMKKDKGDFNLI